MFSAPQNSISPTSSIPNKAPKKSKLLFLIVVIIIVVVVSLGGFWLYTILVRSNDTQDGGDSSKVIEKDDEDEIEDTNEADEEMLPEDSRLEFQNIFQITSSNMLQTRSLAYEYSYTSTNIVSDTEDQKLDVITDTTVYSFQAQHLDDPERRIVQQHIITGLVSEIQETINFHIELQTIRHQDNIYVKLVDAKLDQSVVATVTPQAVDALKGKWLKFTLEEGVWAEMSGDDFRRLSNTEIGQLLQYMHQELTATSIDENAMTAPLRFLGIFSYADSPFVFGYLDKPDVRQRIFENLVYFRDKNDDTTPDQYFIIDDCMQEDSQLTCQTASQLGIIAPEAFSDFYKDILDEVRLSDLILLPDLDSLKRSITDAENLETHQGEVIIDTNQHLPLRAMSETVSTHEDLTIKVRSTNSQITSYKNFNQDLKLTIPKNVTPLSEL